MGGSFTSFNGTHRLGFARLYLDGTVDTTFLDTAYNQLAGLTQVYFHPPHNGTVFASGTQTDGNVLIGGSFDQVGGGQFNANIRPEDYDNGMNQDVWPERKVRDAVRNRSNFARLIGGATPGPGNVGLLNSTYSINRSQSFLYVNLMRTNGSLGYASANFSVQPGLAKSGTRLRPSICAWTREDRGAPANSAKVGKKSICAASAWHSPGALSAGSPGGRA